MKPQDYNCSIAAGVTTKEAFEGINRVSEWWAMGFEGHSQKLNDVFTVRFGETFVTFKIVEVEPNRKMVWQVIDCYLHWINDKTEWKNTKIVWNISAQNNTVHVSFTHLGLVPKLECYDNCQTGWDFYVKESLLKLLTEHKGIPANKTNAGDNRNN